jgi:hypothetical protein
MNARRRHSSYKTSIFSASFALPITFYIHDMQKISLKVQNGYHNLLWKSCFVAMEHGDLIPLPFS